MKIKYALAVVASLLLIGWRSAPPIEAKLSTVLGDPGQFHKKRVEITASVMENPAPTGAEYKKWTFTVGSAGERLAAYEKGFNPATIMKAHYLVERARLEGGEVVLSGKIRAAKNDIGKSGVKLQLDSVRYKDTLVKTDVGPFVEEEYSEGFPWTPLWYDGIKYYPGEFPY